MLGCFHKTFTWKAQTTVKLNVVKNVIQNTEYNFSLEVQFVRNLYILQILLCNKYTYLKIIVCTKFSYDKDISQSLH